MKTPIARHLLVLIAGMLLAHTAIAQMGMGKPKEIKELGERKMIVIVEELNKKAAEKLKKKGKTAELADIENHYEAFNAMVKEVVEKRWTMHKDVEYKTWAAFKRLSDKQREKYGVIYFMSKRASSFNAGYVPAGYTILNSDMDEKDVKEHNFASLFQTFTVDKAEDVPVDKVKFLAAPVYTMTLPELYPTALSVTYAIAMTNAYFEKRVAGEKISRKSYEKEVAENSGRLAEKTLLIREDWKDDALTLGRIKEIYPHPVRTVSPTELADIVASGDPAYAWFVVVPTVNSSSRSNSVIYTQQIVDNATGDVCGMYLPGTGGMMLKSLIGGSSGEDRMTEKSLKEMVKDMTTAEKSR